MEVLGYLSHWPYLHKKDILRAKQTVFWRPCIFIFSNSVEKKEKFHSSTSNFRGAFLLSFANIFQPPFFKKQGDTPSSLLSLEACFAYLNISPNFLMKQRKQ